MKTTIQAMVNGVIMLWEGTINLINFFSPLPILERKYSSLLRMFDNKEEFKRFNSELIKNMSINKNFIFIKDDKNEITVTF